MAVAEAEGGPPPAGAPAGEAPPEAPARGGRAWGLGLAGALALVALVYLPTLRGGFVFDDRPQLAGNPFLRASGLAAVRELALKPLPSGDFGAVETFTYRPLFWLSFILDYHTGGGGPQGAPRPLRFRLTNLALHLANVALLAGLFLGLGLGRAAALAGALAWGLHPAHTEVVAWISGRTDALGTLFVLLALRCWLRAAGGAGRAVGWALAAALLGAAGIFAKETAVVAPLLALGLAGARPPEGRRRALAMVVPLALAVAAAFAWRLQAVPPVGEGEISSLAQRFLALPRLGAAYAGLILAPLWPSVDRSRDLAAAHPGCVALEAALLALLLVLIGRGLRSGAGPGRRLGLAGLWWLAAALGPVSGLVPIYTVLAERYLYLPLAGLALFGAAVLGAGPAGGGAGRGARAGLVLYLLAAAALVLWRGGAYLEDETLYRRSLVASPASHVLHTDLGAELRRQALGLRQSALAAGLSPGAATGLRARAAALDREALAEFDFAVLLNPRYFPALDNSVWLLVERGDCAGAGRRLRGALAARPGDLDTAGQLLELARRRLARGDAAGAGGVAALVLEQLPEGDLARRARGILEQCRGGVTPEE